MGSRVSRCRSPWNWARLLLVLVLAGCADTNQERFRLLSEDGLFLFRQGDYEQARESFASALRLKPDDPDLIFNLGQCYDRLGQGEKAERCYRDCLSLAADHPAAHHALVVLLLRQGRRAEADALIDGWLARSPQQADPYVEDGWRLRQDGDLLAAQGRFQQALALNPRHVRALIELGLLYEQLGWPARALELYQRAWQLQPEQPELAARIQQLQAQGVGRPLPE